MEQALYELSERWDKQTVGELANEIVSGFACSKKNEDPDGHVHLRTHNISVSGNLNFDKIIKIATDKIELKKSSIKAGDVLFNNTNSQELVGKTCIVDKDYDYGFSNHLTRIRVSNDIDPKFFVYRFNQLQLSGHFSHICKRWIGQAGINTNLLKQQIIPLPPLNEQKRIVARLDALFTRIDTAITHLQQTLELSKGLFASALSKKFESKNKNWRSVKLIDICNIASKLLDPRGAEYIDMIHIGGANIESLTGSLIGIKTAREEKLISSKFLFDDKMVLYSKIRPYLMKVARPNINGLCSADIYPLTPESGVFDRDFLFYLLLSEDFTAYAIQGSSRAGMPKVNRKHLFDYEFSMPSFAEQKQITASLDALTEHIRTLEATTQEKLGDLTRLKASLLDAAFKGQL